MKLVDPQPMETFPKEGLVYVQLNSVIRPIHRKGEVDRVRAENARKLQTLMLYAAWSYTATTNPNIIHSMPVIKERCEEIAASIRKGIADEEDAGALDVMAMEIEANYTVTTKEPT